MKRSRGGSDIEDSLRRNRAASAASTGSRERKGSTHGSNRLLESKSSRHKIFKDDIYEICIVTPEGKLKKLSFDCNDPIFKLHVPCTTKFPSNNCSFCEKELVKKEKLFCDFCGSRTCDKCLHKTRKFKSHLT